VTRPAKSKLICVFPSRDHDLVIVDIVHTVHQVKLASLTKIGVDQRDGVRTKSVKSDRLSRDCL
jgi:hypothetical protein